MKRIGKSPWLWIVVAVVGVVLVLQFLAPSGDGDEITSSEMTAHIAAGEVKTITFVDGDQEIRATLDEGVRDDGAEVMTYWICGTQSRLYNLAQQQVENGEIELNYTPTNNQPANGLTKALGGQSIEAARMQLGTAIV